MEAVPFQTVVRHRPSGQLGVVIPDPFKVCTPEETFVVWDGYDVARGVLTAELKVIGPENARADPIKCGDGQGKNCCIFLTPSWPRGDPPAPLYDCSRFGLLRLSLIGNGVTGKIGAQRHPTQLYPGCQLP